MRDISTDLKDRLKAFERERGQIVARLQELDALEITVNEMLRLEEKIQTKGQANLFGRNGDGPNTTSFVRTALSENAELSVPEILKIASDSEFLISGARQRISHFRCKARPERSGSLAGSQKAGDS